MTTCTSVVFTVREPAGMMSMSSSPPVVPQRQREFIQAEDINLSLYVHGVAQDKAGFDLPLLVEGRFEVAEYTDLPCVLELPTQKIDCLLFIWDTKRTCVSLLSGKTKRAFQGLIVAVGDEPALAYARRKGGDRAFL